MSQNPYPKGSSQNHSVKELFEWGPSKDVLYVATFTILLVALIVLLADLYLIAIIVRYKKLRTRLNIFIVLYAVAQINSILIDIMYDSLEGFARCLMYFSLTLLALDWYVRSYHQTFYKQYGTLFIMSIGVGFVATLIINTMLFMILSPDRNYDFSELYFFGACSTIVLCLVILRQKKKPVINIGKTVYAYIVPQVLFSMSAITGIVLYALRGIDNEDFIIIIESLSDCFIMSQTFVMMFLLSKLNKHFKMAHSRCFKRRASNEYSDDDLDSISQNEIPESNIAFNRNTELVEMKI